MEQEGLYIDRLSRLYAAVVAERQEEQVLQEEQALREEQALQEM